MSIMVRAPCYRLLHCTSLPSRTRGSSKAKEALWNLISFDEASIRFLRNTLGGAILSIPKTRKGVSTRLAVICLHHRSKTQTDDVQSSNMFLSDYDISGNSGYYGPRWSIPPHLKRFAASRWIMHGITLPSEIVSIVLTRNLMLGILGFLLPTNIFVECAQQSRKLVFSRAKN